MNKCTIISDRDFGIAALTEGGDIFSILHSQHKNILEFVDTGTEFTFEKIGFHSFDVIVRKIEQPEKAYNEEEVKEIKDQLIRSEKQGYIALVNALRTIDAFIFPCANPDQMGQYDKIKGHLLKVYKVEEPEQLLAIGQYQDCNNAEKSKFEKNII